MAYKKLYLDDNDVERGYYVYAHQCKASGVVFYVGRGHGQRAWSGNRSNAWKEHVASLEDGFDVVLLHEDLTEEESYKIERAEIQAHGGAGAEGGKLVNWLPYEALSLDIGLGVEIGLELPPASKEQQEEEEERHKAYWAVRKFKEMARSERRLIEKRYYEACPSTEKIGEKYEWYWDRDREDEVPDYLEDAKTAADNLEDLVGNISRHKISYNEFCDDIADEITTIKDSVEQLPKTGKHVALVRKFVRELVKWQEKFEIPGNLEEANQQADNVANKYFKRKHGVDILSDEGRTIRARELEEAYQSALENLRDDKDI